MSSIDSSTSQLSSEQQEVINRDAAKALEQRMLALSTTIAHRHLGAAVDLNPRTKVRYQTIEDQRARETARINYLETQRKKDEQIKLAKQLQSLGISDESNVHSMTSQPKRTESSDSTSPVLGPKSGASKLTSPLPALGVSSPPLSLKTTSVIPQSPPPDLSFTGSSSSGKAVSSSSSSADSKVQSNSSVRSSNVSLSNSRSDSDTTGRRRSVTGVPSQSNEVAPVGRHGSGVSNIKSTRRKSVEEFTFSVDDELAAADGMRGRTGKRNSIFDAPELPLVNMAATSQDVLNSSFQSGVTFSDDLVEHDMKSPVLGSSGKLLNGSFDELSHSDHESGNDLSSSIDNAHLRIKVNKTKDSHTVRSASESSKPKDLKSVKAKLSSQYGRVTFSAGHDEVEKRRRAMYEVILSKLRAIENQQQLFFVNSVAFDPLCVYASSCSTQQGMAGLTPTPTPGLANPGQRGIPSCETSSFSSFSPGTTFSTQRKSPSKDKVDRERAPTIRSPHESCFHALDVHLPKIARLVSCSVQLNYSSSKFAYYFLSQTSLDIIHDCFWFIHTKYFGEQAWASEIRRAKHLREKEASLLREIEESKATNALVDPDSSSEQESSVESLSDSSEAVVSSSENNGVISDAGSAASPTIDSSTAKPTVSTGGLASDTTGGSSSLDSAHRQKKKRKTKRMLAMALSLEQLSGKRSMEDEDEQELDSLTPSPYTLLSLELLADSLARGYVRLMKEVVANRFLFFTPYPYAVAEAVFVAFLTLLPASRARFSALFRLQVYVEIVRLLSGVDVTAPTVLHQMDKYFPGHLHLDGQSPATASMFLLPGEAGNAKARDDATCKAIARNLGFRFVLDLFRTTTFEDRLKMGYKDAVKVELLRMLPKGLTIPASAFFLSGVPVPPVLLSSTANIGAFLTMVPLEHAEYYGNGPVSPPSKNATPSNPNSSKSVSENLTLSNSSTISSSYKLGNPFGLTDSKLALNNSLRSSLPSQMGGNTPGYTLGGSSIQKNGNQMNASLGRSNSPSSAFKLSSTSTYILSKAAERAELSARNETRLTPMHEYKNNGLVSAKVSGYLLPPRRDVAAERRRARRQESLGVLSEDTKILARNLVDSPISATTQSRQGFRSSTPSTSRSRAGGRHRGSSEGDAYNLSDIDLSGIPPSVLAAAGQGPACRLVPTARNDLVFSLDTDQKYREMILSTGQLESERNSMSNRSRNAGDDFGLSLPYVDDRALDEQDQDDQAKIQLNRPSEHSESQSRTLTPSLKSSLSSRGPRSAVNRTVSYLEDASFSKISAEPSHFAAEAADAPEGTADVQFDPLYGVFYFPDGSALHFSEFDELSENRQFVAFANRAASHLQLRSPLSDGSVHPSASSVFIPGEDAPMEAAQSGEDMFFVEEPVTFVGDNSTQQPRKDTIDSSVNSIRKEDLKSVPTASHFSNENLYIGSHQRTQAPLSPSKHPYSTPRDHTTDLSSFLPRVASAHFPQSVALDESAEGPAVPALPLQLLPPSSGPSAAENVSDSVKRSLNHLTSMGRKQMSSLLNKYMKHVNSVVDAQPTATSSVLSINSLGKASRSLRKVVRKNAHFSEWITDMLQGRGSTLVQLQQPVALEPLSQTQQLMSIAAPKNTVLSEDEERKIDKLAALADISPAEYSMLFSAARALSGYRAYVRNRLHSGAELHEILNISRRALKNIGKYCESELSPSSASGKPKNKQKSGSKTAQNLSSTAAEARSIPHAKKVGSLDQPVVLVELPENQRKGAKFGDLTNEVQNNNSVVAGSDVDPTPVQLQLSPSRGSPAKSNSGTYNAPGSPGSIASDEEYDLSEYSEMTMPLDFMEPAAIVALSALASRSSRTNSTSTFSNSVSGAVKFNKELVAQQYSQTIRSISNLNTQSVPHSAALNIEESLGLVENVAGGGVVTSHASATPVPLCSRSAQEIASLMPRGPYYHSERAGSFRSFHSISSGSIKSLTLNSDSAPESFFADHHEDAAVPTLPYGASLRNANGLFSLAHTHNLLQGTEALQAADSLTRRSTLAPLRLPYISSATSTLLSRHRANIFSEAQAAAGDLSATQRLPALRVQQAAVVRQTVPMPWSLVGGLDTFHTYFSGREVSSRARKTQRALLKLKRRQEREAFHSISGSAQASGASSGSLTSAGATTGIEAEREKERQRQDREREQEREKENSVLDFSGLGVPSLEEATVAAATGESAELQALIEKEPDSEEELEKQLLMPFYGVVATEADPAATKLFVENSAKVAAKSVEKQVTITAVSQVNKLQMRRERLMQLKKKKQESKEGEGSQSVSALPSDSLVPSASPARVTTADTSLDLKQRKPRKNNRKSGIDPNRGEAQRAAFNSASQRHEETYISLSSDPHETRAQQLGLGRRRPTSPGSMKPSQLITASAHAVSVLHAKARHQAQVETAEGLRHVLAGGKGAIARAVREINLNRMQKQLERAEDVRTRAHVRAIGIFKVDDGSENEDFASPYKRYNDSNNTGGGSFSDMKKNDPCLVGAVPLHSMMLTVHSQSEANNANLSGTNGAADAPKNSGNSAPGSAKKGLFSSNGSTGGANDLGALVASGASSASDANAMHLNLVQVAMFAKATGTFKGDPSMFHASTLNRRI